jgi:hypothetical protein
MHNSNYSSTIVETIYGKRGSKESGRERATFACLLIEGINSTAEGLYEQYCARRNN